MANTTYATLSANGAVSAYLSAKILPITKRQTLFYNLGTKEPLPQGESTTVQFTRYNRIPLPTAKLADGVSPTPVALVNTKVTATMDQWGLAVTLTDIAILTIKHPLMQVAIDLLGRNAAETIDREVQTVLMGGTAINYTTGTTRAGLGNANVVTTVDVQKATARLRRLGAYEYDGYQNVNPADATDTTATRKGAFVGIADQAVEQDIIKDATFVNAASYSNITVLHEDEIGIWMGVRWMRSNFIPALVGIAAVGTAGVNVAGGTLAAGTTYYITVTGVDAMTGVERIVSQETTQAPGGGNTAIAVTMPTLAASLGWFNASEDLTNPFTFNIYIGTATGVTYQYGTGYNAADVINVLSVPTSGAPPAAPATGVTVHLTYVMGRDAFKVSEIQALQTYLTPPGPSDSDKLAQRRSVGWKVAFKSVIANQSFLVRIESGSAFNV